MVMNLLGKLTTNARKSFSRESCEPPDPFKVTTLRCLGAWQTVMVDSTSTPRTAIALQINSVSKRSNILAGIRLV